MFKLIAATIAALLVATSAAPKPQLVSYGSPFVGAPGVVSAYGAGPVVSAYGAPVVSSPYVASPLAYSAYNPVSYLG